MTTPLEQAREDRYDAQSDAAKWDYHILLSLGGDALAGGFWVANEAQSGTNWPAIVVGAASILYGAFSYWRRSKNIVRAMEFDHTVVELTGDPQSAMYQRTVHDWRRQHTPQPSGDHLGNLAPGH